MPGLLDNVEDLHRLLWEGRNRLPQFVIYDHPADFPEHYVGRLWFALPEVTHTNITIRAAEPGPIREVMEALGLVCLPRQEGDDPTILEVWT